MDKPFDKYKNVSKKVISLLINEDCSSLQDIKILYNIIMKFPYCLDCEGRYTYNGEFYNSIQNLPNDALEQLRHRYK